MKNITLDYAEEIIKRNPNTKILDLRNIRDYNKGHLSGAICVNAYNIKNEIDKILLNKTTPIIIYCYSGSLSRPVGLILEDLGYENIFDLGYVEKF